MTRLIDPLDIPTDPEVTDFSIRLKSYGLPLSVNPHKPPAHFVLIGYVGPLGLARLAFPELGGLIPLSRTRNPIRTTRVYMIRNVIEALCNEGRIL